MDSHRKAEKVVTENDYICHLCGLRYKDTNDFKSHTAICEETTAPTEIEEFPRTEDSHEPPQTPRTPACIPTSTPRDMSNTESDISIIKRIVSNTLRGDTPTHNQDIRGYWEVKNMEVRENEGSTTVRQWETHHDTHASWSQGDIETIVIYVINQQRIGVTLTAIWKTSMKEKLYI